MKTSHLFTGGLLVALMTMALAVSPATAGTVSSGIIAEVQTSGGAGDYNIVDITDDGLNGNGQPIGLGLQDDSDMFLDRAYEWQSVPSFLVGQAFIQTRNNDKNFIPTFQADITFGGDATAYLLMFGTSSPQGPSAGLFTDTGFDMAAEEDSSPEVGLGTDITDIKSISIFSASVTDGQTISLTHSGGLQWGLAAVPTAAAVPEPSGVILVLSGVIALLALNRRRRR